MSATRLTTQEGAHRIANRFVKRTKKKKLFKSTRSFSSGLQKHSNFALSFALPSSILPWNNTNDFGGHGHLSRVIVLQMNLAVQTQMEQLAT